jgi:hypothetical protein
MIFTSQIEINSFSNLERLLCICRLILGQQISIGQRGLYRQRVATRCAVGSCPLSVLPSKLVVFIPLRKKHRIRSCFFLRSIPTTRRPLLKGNVRLLSHKLREENNAEAHIAEPTVRGAVAAKR